MQINKVSELSHETITKASSEGEKITKKNIKFVNLSLTSAILSHK